MKKQINNNLKAVAIIFAIVGVFGGILGFANLAGAQCGGSTCGEVPLTCSPQSQTGSIGESINFTAEGGDGNFSWSAPGSNNRSGSSQNFSTSYSSSGYKTVYVTSGTQTKTCAVRIEGPVAETHKACVNNACTIVAGPGPNTCSRTSDCVVVPPPPSCDFAGALTGNITSYSGAQAYATVTNNSSCTKTVTFASYRVFIEPGNPGWLDTQVLHDHQTVTLSAGQTQQLTVNNASCRTQLDVYEGQVQPHLSDAAGGFPGQNLLDYAFTSDPLCGTVQTLACSPANQTVGINATANFSATGGTGTYSWSASGGSPASGSLQNFSTSYSTSGSKTVTVTSGNQTANCNVTVNPPIELQLSCSPTNQSVFIGGIANFSATGGNGNYSWSTNIGGDAGNPANGTGANFSTAYGTPGYKTVTVSSGNQIATCHVTVNEIPQQTLTCNPQNQSVFVNSSANFTATGGNGTYSWSGGESPVSGSGANFSTSYSSVGFRTVTVTSGNQTATCNVIVNTQPQQNLSCNPQSQSGNVGSYLSFNATGGNGTYNWIASDGNPTTGSGSSFSTQFNSAGFRTVIVNSGNQTATCNVTINQQPPQNNLTCGPQNQSANVNDVVNFYANGGNGSYSWTAYDAQITYGNNQNFSTRFNSVGSKTVVVNSGGQSATCYVNVNNLFGSNTYFQISKNVLNRTLNQNVYVNSTEAQSNDLLEFEIRIRNNGNTSAEVNLRDVLPADLNYVYGSATVNSLYLNDSVINYNGVSLGNLYPGEEKIVRLRATVRPNAALVSITNQAVATMNSNTQNAFATIQIRNRGQVLGAADIVTGPEDVMPWVLSLGFISSLIVYFYFFYSRPEKRRASFAVATAPANSEDDSSSEEVAVFKAVKPKKELDALISEFKKRETSPDI